MINYRDGMNKMIQSDLIDEQMDEGELEPAQQEGVLSDEQIEQRYIGSSFRVLYQSNNYFLPQIRDLIQGAKIIKLRPEYQRRLRWTTKQKSLLIESLLLNVPVPPVFLYENDLARYEVMDGQQRLSAIDEFLANNFELSGLESLKFLAGKRYNELPPKLKRGLDRASISAIVLLHESQADDRDPSLIRRYVFQRLNTGGKALNPQEIRNSYYSGAFNDLIIKLARLPKFCEAFDIPAYTERSEEAFYENPERRNNRFYKTMGDCQLVLRFFAFREDAYIRGSVRAMLDAAMERHESATPQELDSLQTAFADALNTAHAIFGNDVFTLAPDDNGTRRVSIALYDAIMVSLDRNTDKAADYIAEKATITTGVDALSVNGAGLMTGRANTAQSIKDRISAVMQVLDRAVP